MTVLFLIISIILVCGLLIPMLFSDNLLNAVMRFTGDYYASGINFDFEGYFLEY